MLLNCVKLFFLIPESDVQEHFLTDSKIKKKNLKLYTANRLSHKSQNDQMGH